MIDSIFFMSCLMCICHEAFFVSLLMFSSLLKKFICYIFFAKLYISDGYPETQLYIVVDQIQFYFSAAFLVKNLMIQRK